MSLQDSSAPHTVRGYGVNIQSFEVLAREHISGSGLMVVVRSKVRPRTLHRRVRVGHVGNFRPPPTTSYLHVLRPKLRMQTLQSAYRQGRKLVLMRSMMAAYGSGRGRGQGAMSWMAVPRAIRDGAP